MEHGVSWFSFLPGIDQVQAYFAHHYQGTLFGQMVVIQHVLAAMLVTVMVMLVSFRARAQMLRGDALVPKPEVSVRNLVEVVLEALYKQAQQTIGPQAPRYFPVLATLTLFIFFSNVLGLIPGFIPPTDNWNTTFACSIFVFLYYNYQGLRVNGMAHLAHMANPAGTWWGWFLAPLMFPIELIGHLARPVTLGVRLATNMIGDHAVLATFLSLVPVLVPLPFLALGLLVSMVQTLVFVLLTMTYISMAIEVAHHDDHGHEPAAAGAH